MPRKIVIIFILFLLSVTLSACSISFKGTAGGGNDNGVYRSETRGDKWLQKVLIPTVTGKPRSIGGINVASLVLDPSDDKALYLGSEDNGLFFTYDRGENWQAVGGLGKNTIAAVAVDPASKCVIYAASANKVYKSTDCSRTWTQAYYDNDVNVVINAIAIDSFNSANVCIGTSRGEVIKSSDRGASWQTVGRFDDSVEKIVISPHDSKIIFAATKRKRIFRSIDGAINWIDLSENLKEFKDSMRFRDLVASPSDKGLIILATHYGLLKSTSSGEIWSKIELITPEKEATINALAIGPQTANEIYYITNTTFYRSLDGGRNWTTKKLPTTKAGSKLLIDPEDASVIYMGVRAIKN
ncbi:hypothetical protein HY798_03100 [Candidatus Falkowbacteria bacterium]|nr:hypothetical protein [Candidatus Falkowbacteria bacterium]